MDYKEIPVLLLTGYLGSGKTTLLNRILNNERGIKFAVIVNDIGEVNIDADLIEKGGVVGQKDDNLVALQNGCICCTLKMDLVEQLADITKQNKFDYIVIEASGICEPGPIAQTICNIPNLVTPEVIGDTIPAIDCIITVVDALRMKDEFQCGHNLVEKKLDEEDIENLVIQQIEFCNRILLNKASEVSKEELGRIRQIIKTIQPKAEIIECDFCDVDFDKILHTRDFDFDSVALSAKWIQEIEGDPHEEEDKEEEEEEHDHEHHHHHEHEHHHEHHHDDEDDEECPHCHEHHHHDEECHCECHHHHHHHDGEGEAEEYGIGTFVYYARKPLKIGMFDDFVARKWPKNIIRAKGICYFDDERDICYVFEQAGRQVNLRNAGQWYATMPEWELRQMLANDEKLQRDWDEVYGDRMQKLVFIGQKLDKKAIKEALDACLAD